MSLLESGTTENEMPRMVSLCIGLPASAHFFRKAVRLVLSKSLLSLASSSNSTPGAGPSPPVHPFCVTAKVNWPCGKSVKSLNLTPRSRSNGATSFSFHLAINLSWNGFITASFQKSHCGDCLPAARSVEKSGTVMSNSVSDGSRFSAGGIAARTGVANVSNTASVAEKIPAAGCGVKRKMRVVIMN